MATAPVAEYWEDGSLPRDSLSRAAERLKSRGSLYLGAGIGVEVTKSDTYKVIGGGTHDGPLSAMTQALSLAGKKKAPGTPGGLQAVTDPAIAARIFELDSEEAEVKATIRRMERMLARRKMEPAAATQRWDPMAVNDLTWEQRRIEESKVRLRQIKSEREELLTGKVQEDWRSQPRDPGGEGGGQWVGGGAKATAKKAKVALEKLPLTRSDAAPPAVVKSAERVTVNGKDAGTIKRIGHYSRLGGSYTTGWQADFTAWYFQPPGFRQRSGAYGEQAQTKTEAKNLAQAWAAANLQEAEAGKPGTNWKQVGAKDKQRLSGLMRHYAKKAHPFTACVNDNTKRFGPERAKKVCAVLKDLIRRSTKWRVNEMLTESVIWDMEAGLHQLLEVADYDVEGLERYLLRSILEAEVEQTPEEKERRRTGRRGRKALAQAALGRADAGTPGDVDLPDAGVGAL